MNEAIEKKTLTLEELSSLIGKLNHVCYIIPDARHFMNNLRQMERLARRIGKVKLTRRTLDDLILWLEFLTSAEKGISINRIIFRKPSLVTFADASEIGICGYSPKTTILWRYQFTPLEAATFTLNTKEYLGQSIDTDFQNKMDNNTGDFPCILSRGDSSSVVGWLRKSNHDPDDAPIHNEIARWHARNIMKANACNYSQHLEGSKNVIVDSGSHDFHLNDDQLKAMLTSLHPSLPPSRLQVVDLPEKYTSWIASLAQKWPGTRELPKKHIKSTLSAGVAGWTSSTGSTTSTAPSWKENWKCDEYASAVPLCMQCDKATLADISKRSGSTVTLRERPSTMWQRDLWLTVGKAPSSTQQAGPTSTSNARREDTNGKTQPENTKKPSHQ
jgi:hypothetical protein